MDITIRKAIAADAPTIRQFLHLMLEEMASMGGHKASSLETVWADLERRAARETKRQDHVYFLAETIGSEPSSLGLAEASIATPEPLLKTDRTLHIHALYVQQPHRKAGIGSALLEATLVWGRAAGCKRATLHVLMANPARRLYESAGFESFEIEMTRRL